MLDWSRQSAEVETVVHPSQTYDIWLSLRLTRTHVFRAVLLNMRARVLNALYSAMQSISCNEYLRVISRVRTANVYNLEASSLQAL